MKVLRRHSGSPGYAWRAFLAKAAVLTAGGALCFSLAAIGSPAAVSAAAAPVVAADAVYVRLQDAPQGARSGDGVAAAEVQRSGGGGAAAQDAVMQAPRRVLRHEVVLAVEQAARLRAAAARAGRARAAALRALVARPGARRTGRPRAGRPVPQRAAVTTSGAPAGTPEEVAGQLLAAYGWAGQFSCLDSLWNAESGWNVYAENPSSGAYGIPQALPGAKMAAAGADWQSDAATQIRWGLTYILQTYGSPCAAWGHEEAVGWY
jgi:hypothetical protein